MPLPRKASEQDPQELSYQDPPLRPNPQAVPRGMTEYPSSMQVKEVSISAPKSYIVRIIWIVAVSAEADLSVVQ